MIARSLQALVLVATTTLEATTHAKPPVEHGPIATPASRVFMAPLVADGDLTDALQIELTTRLRDALEGPEIVASEATATHRIHASVRSNDHDLDLRIELRTIDGDVVAFVEDRCELCGRTEAADTFTSLGHALRRRMEHVLHPPPVVSLRTDAPAPRRAMVLEPPEGRRPLRWGLGWAALSTGAVGTLSGVTLLALHGQPIRHKCTGSDVDADGTCRFVHSTLVPGAVVGAIGVGLLATGIALVVIERRRSPRPATQARLGLGPTGPSLRF